LYGEKGFEKRGNKWGGAIMDQVNIKWTPAISVHEDTIDEQHKKILSAIAEIEEGLSGESGEKIKAIRAAIHFLYGYIREHLSYEEDYMKRNKYSGFAGHKKIHDAFVESYEKFNIEFTTKLAKVLDSKSLTKEYGEKIHKFLGEWWMNHISTVDHEYCEEINPGKCGEFKKVYKVVKKGEVKEKLSKKSKVEEEEEGDDNVKYFLKTPELKEKLVKSEPEPVVEAAPEPVPDNSKELDNAKKELEAARKELEENQKRLEEEKTKEQELIAEKEKLAHEHEENIKAKIQEALEKQKQTLEAQLKKQFEHREGELNQKMADEEKAFSEKERKLNESHNKKQSSFAQKQKELQKKLKSQEKLELTKAELDKKRKEIASKITDLEDKERDFQALRDQKENDFESKRKDLDSRFENFKNKEVEEFAREKDKITEGIREHVSKEFHDKLEAAEEKLRARFDSESSEKVKKLEARMNSEKNALLAREQKLVEEDSQKQIALDQTRTELEKKNMAFESMSNLSKQEIGGLKGEISNLSGVLKAEEEKFQGEKAALGQKERKLINDVSQRQALLDETRAELDKKNLELQRVGRLSKEQAERLRGEINDLSTTLKREEAEFAKERNDLRIKEKELVAEYNKKQETLDKLQEELESKVLIFEMAEQLGKKEIKELKDEIKKKNLALEEKQKEIEIERIKKQKDFEINKRDLEIKFENFKNQENEKFNAKVIESRKKIFEDAHRSLSKKFEQDLKVRGEGLRREMEGRISKLKGELKRQADAEVKKGISEKIGKLEEGLKGQIRELEGMKGA
jgi:hemerythrin-like metal-binding protein